MVQEQSVLTNKPFQTLCDVMMLEVPENITINIKMSTDGEDYHDVDEPITGPEIVEIGPLVRGARMLFESNDNIKIKIKA